MIPASVLVILVMIALVGTLIGMGVALNAAFERISDLEEAHNAHVANYSIHHRDVPKPAA